MRSGCVGSVLCGVVCFRCVCSVVRFPFLALLPWFSSVFSWFPLPVVSEPLVRLLASGAPAVHPNHGCTPNPARAIRPRACSRPLTRINWNDTENISRPPWKDDAHKENNARGSGAQRASPAGGGLSTPGSPPRVVSPHGGSRDGVHGSGALWASPAGGVP